MKLKLPRMHTTDKNKHTEMNTFRRHNNTKECREKD